MLVKHKVTGKEYEVSEDYFDKYEDTLQVLEVVKPTKETTTKNKNKKTKIVTDEAPALASE